MPKISITDTNPSFKFFFFILIRKSFLNRQQSLHHDGYIKYPWFHIDCIFESEKFPKHLKDIENFYLIGYDDQLKIARKMNIHLELDSDIEKKIKCQTDEMFGYVTTMESFKKNDLEDFLEINGLNRKWPKGIQDKVGGLMNKTCILLTDK